MTAGHGFGVERGHDASVRPRGPERGHDASVRSRGPERGYDTRVGSRVAASSWGSLPRTAADATKIGRASCRERQARAYAGRLLKDRHTEPRAAKPRRP